MRCKITGLSSPHESWVQKNTHHCGPCHI